MTARVRLRGFEHCLAKLQTMSAESKPATASSTLALAESILQDVKASRPGSGVPRDTGRLANSGDATGPDAGGRSYVSFGGPEAPYALIQHEVAGVVHESGEARYLIRGAERAEASGTPVESLRAAADEIVRKGKTT